MKKKKGNEKAKKAEEKKNATSAPLALINAHMYIYIYPVPLSPSCSGVYGFRCRWCINSLPEINISFVELIQTH